MIIASADINMTKNNLRATEALEVAEDAVNDAANNEKAWYLSSTVLQSANGQNKNFYGAETPTNPIAGDLWFAYDIDGNVSDMLRFDGANWIAEIDLSTAKKYLLEAENLARRMDSDRATLDGLFDGVASLWTESNATNTKVASIKASVDGIQTKVTSIEDGSASVITQLSNRINAKVEKGNVVAQINVEADSGVYIQGKAIILDGNTTVRGTFSVNAAQVTGKLSASQIAVDSLSAISADLGNITAGTLKGVSFIGGKFKADPLNPNWRDFSTSIDGYGVDLTTTENGSKLTISLINPMINYRDPNGNTGFSLNPKYAMSKAFISFADQSYVGGYNGLSVIAGSSWENNIISYRPCRASEFNTSAVTIGNASIGVGGAFNGSSDTTNTSIGSNNGYFPGKVYASGVALTSSRDKKKNIVTFEENALTLIDKMRAVTYQLKKDNENELHRLGFILEEMPLAELIDVEGGVDQYALTTLAIKAIQELNQKVEVLELANN